MDRQIVYVNSIPLDTDILSTNKNTMIALGFLMQAVLGTATRVFGLSCTQTAPLSMNVVIGQGGIVSLSTADASSYGSLQADTAPLMKMGILYVPTNLTLTPPASNSVIYVVQCAFSEIDAGTQVLSYVNAAQPSQPFSGPSGTGISQTTVRQQKCVISLLQGVSGTVPAVPVVVAPNIGLWDITVASGATTIVNGNIAAHSGSPFITHI